MNKQGNTYTFLYSVILVVVVAALLSIVSLSLKDKQQANIENEKRQNILSAIKVTATPAEAIAKYNEYIKSSFLVNCNGEKVEGDAFNENIVKNFKTLRQINKLTSEDSEKNAKEIATLKSELRFPVFVAEVNGETKYILPFYGSGLWGPIWSYISVNADKNTIYSVFFDHKGETPGLGAEITKYERFGSKFEGKNFFSDGVRTLIVKKGANPATEVDAISGGTITSKGVDAMLNDYLECYKPFLKAE